MPSAHITNQNHIELKLMIKIKVDKDKSKCNTHRYLVKHTNITISQSLVMMYLQSTSVVVIKLVKRGSPTLLVVGANAASTRHW